MIDSPFVLMPMPKAVESLAYVDRRPLHSGDTEYVERVVKIQRVASRGQWSRCETRVAIVVMDGQKPILYMDDPTVEVDAHCQRVIDTAGAATRRLREAVTLLMSSRASDRRRGRRMARK